MVEKITKDGMEYFKVVYKPPFKDEKEQEWLFREFSCGEFMALDITDELIKGKTKVGQSTAPMIYMINAMMVEGDKITEKTKNRIYSYLHQELADFLA